MKLYESVYKKIEEDIKSGFYKEGEKLPSIIGFTKKYGVSKNTVLKSMELLEYDGLIHAKKKSGFYVTDNLYPKIQVTNLHKREFQRSDDFEYDLSPNAVSYDQFPIAIVKRLMTEVLNSDYTTLFSPTEPQGSLELRESIAYILNRIKDIKVAPKNIILSSGMEYLYQIILELLPNDSIFAIENPGYDIVPTLLNSRKFPYIDIDSKNVKNGINTLINSNANVLCTTSMHQFPIGRTMSSTEKEAIINWMRSSKNNYIIEDDYDSEFRYAPVRSDRIYTMSGAERTIYIGSFSKSIAPSIRCSYMILPEELMEKYNETLPFMACPIPSIWQKFLTEFIDKHYIRHVNKMIKLYKGRREKMIELLEASGKVKKIIAEPVGTNILVEIKTYKSDTEIVKAAQEKGVLVFPLSRYLRGSKPTGTYLSLGFAALDDEKMEKAISILLSCC